LTVLLINVWEVTPLGASAILSAIPLATALTERTIRGRSPIALGAIGAVTLAAGLTALALVSHRQLSWVILARAACGTGLGMAFPALTEAALKRSPGSPVDPAARTSLPAMRDSSSAC
jgi:MFS family permease